MNWNELVLVAEEIVTEFGQAITVKSVTQGAYDTQTGQITSIVTEITTIGVLFDYGEKDINGTTVLKGDKKVLIKPVGLTNVTVNDSIVINGEEYHITMVTQTNPAGTNLLWEVSIRGLS